jgi:4-coumarate--CoA ligase
MTTFSSPYTSLLPIIPDDQTLPQFMFSYQHQSLHRPHRPSHVPSLIEDHTGRRISWDELRERVAALAWAFQSNWNISDNDTVCLFSPNHVDYPVAMWAIHSLGGIVSPANPAYTSEELVHQLQVIKPALILTHEDSLKAVLSACRTVGIPEDRCAIFQSGGATTNLASVDQLVESGKNHAKSFVPKSLAPGEGKTRHAFISFSSGTTGKPKAIPISHYNAIANVIQTAVHWKCNNPDSPSTMMPVGGVVMGVLPFYHIYGLIVSLHFALFAGMTLVVVPKFNFLSFLESITVHKITHLLVVPPQVVLLCKHPAVKNYNISHLQVILSGAAPLSNELIQMLGKLLPNTRIAQGYGATEATGTISICPAAHWTNVAGSSGQLLPGILARVVKPDGSFGGVGEQGELLIAGPNIALEYLNDPKATQETFIDGWLRTGDEVRLDQDTNVFVVDRLKEIIKVKGFQVAPAELEGHLLDHPDVADSCVVGVPDDFSGEVPLAFVVLKDEARQRVNISPSEMKLVKESILKHVEVAKSKYKWLSGGVVFTDTIPKSPSGKILRRLLRDRARTHKTNARSTL